VEFEDVTLEQLLGELVEVEADWQDETGLQVIAALPTVIAEIRDTDELTATHIADMLRRNPHTFDVFRLFFSLSQDRLANRMSESLGRQLTYSALRRLSRVEPEPVAESLLALGLSEEVAAHIGRSWSVEDVLVERYKLMRGRAVAGQARGRALEDEVQAILEGAQISFARGVTFTGRDGKTAKADFAIPTKEDPKIVIEAKAYEATGSKLTDFLGDIAKIGEAKGYHRYFFVVTDGIGWRNRESDLRHVVDQHHAGLIENIYTRSRLQRLAADIVHIIRHEM
jgi:hypothetical protein